MYKKASEMHVQSSCFANLNVLVFFAVLVAIFVVVVSSAPCIRFILCEVQRLTLARNI